MATIKSKKASRPAAEPGELSWTCKDTRPRYGMAKGGAKMSGMKTYGHACTDIIGTSK